jgi:hypothetical protein
MFRPPADEVHPIQARKAWEDRECWVKVRIIDIVGTHFIVRLPSGEEATLYCGVAARARNVFKGRPIRAVWCERWCVLGIPRRSDAEGGPFALAITDPPAPMFRLARSREVRLFNVRRVKVYPPLKPEVEAPPSAVLIDRPGRQRPPTSP